ncbi:SRPBCC domain-containing protein [Gramella sp. MAR_2010_147]|uniref:SRPBCC family protein n=1 Tax=Gramella sp. MAR_2010_147 TaxID=1250205 RepID=UPI00087B2E59|nr:SRPBCC domain-containing protein [Gramella sp. MAR_2010_147]SDR67126.1 Activator of Hsp90 ATPase homolog 1-like protein [Gramella sp. MAR_2010_147]
MGERKKLDWSSFTVNIPIDNPREKIIEAWMTPKILENWFLRLAEFSTGNGEKRKRDENIQPGDSYRWQWYGWPDNIEEHGEVLHPEEGEFLRFIFGKAGKVGVRIVEENGQQILRLVQENIPQDEESIMNFYVGCKTGWTFYMLNLKSILQGGPDLRNKRSELQMD